MDGMDKFQSDMAAINARVDRLLRERAELRDMVAWFINIMDNAGWENDVATIKARALLSRLEDK